MTKHKRNKTDFGLNTLVWKEGNLYVAKAVEIEIASQGKTAKQALVNLKEALELYFEDEKIPADKINTFPDLELTKLFPKIRYA